MNGDPKEPLLLRVKAAADMLSVSRSKLYELIQQNAVPHVRVGNSLRIPLNSLRDWIEQQLTQRSEIPL